MPSFPTPYIAIFFWLIKSELSLILFIKSIRDFTKTLELTIIVRVIKKLINITDLGKLGIFKFIKIIPVIME